MMAFLNRRLQVCYENAKGPVETVLHGYNAWLNPGNMYPFVLQELRHFNAPLVELVNQTYHMKGSKVIFVDVGSAIGDTVLLLKQRCPSMVERYLCIEGDPEFCRLLAHNVSAFNDVDIIRAVLARQMMSIRSLVKHHRGTAASLGATMIAAQDLDSVEELKRVPIDIVKTDVDGFDGEVLWGAKRLLKAYQPSVIFEWHPKLTIATGHHPLAAFDALGDCGYRRFLWFSNIGTFSHFSSGVAPEIVNREMEYLLKVNSRADEHFDVVALPDASKVDEVALAAMDYARSRT